MNGFSSFEMVKTYELGGEALYNFAIDGEIKMKSVPMSQIMKYLNNIHEDEGDDDGSY